ncbi:3-phosphoshikimate 1-carboxyvinyltransferase [Sporolactobacillus sp. THM7-7]|nr:3-phosphoshikimate 1-carboxyvinyltransferase [Sporolactobacillus sp. THM7-7]
MTESTFFGEGKPIAGEIAVPGDKSISHRAVIFGSIASGTTTIDGFLRGNDCLSTLACMRALGVGIDDSGDRITVHGHGFDGLKEPSSVLDVGNSGTTIRLLSGLLSARPFYTVLAGDASIHKRPMGRVIDPLTMMGGKLWARRGNRFAPISIKGRPLHAIRYTLPVASAQVKSALLLAGLQTEGVTVLTEPGPSRDHTERMIQAFGGDIRTEGFMHRIAGPQTLAGIHVRVPGDFSSAAFFIAAALLTPGSHLVLRSVGVNPTRIGMVDILRKMGGNIHFSNERDWNGEPVADIEVEYGTLRAAEIGGPAIPRLIDELPVMALIATEAEGTTVIKDAAELKVKETNRIQTTVEQLRKIGADIEETDDGMIVRGHPGRRFTGGTVDSAGDHRIGMMLAIAAQKSDNPVSVCNAEAMAVSFPSFRDRLAALKK